MCAVSETLQDFVTLWKGVLVVELLRQVQRPV
jgi:hypothetical protein